MSDDCPGCPKSGKCNLEGKTIKQINNEQLEKDYQEYLNKWGLNER